MLYSNNLCAVILLKKSRRCDGCGIKFSKNTLGIRSPVIDAYFWWCHNCVKASDKNHYYYLDAKVWMLNYIRLQKLKGILNE